LDILKKPLLEEKSKKLLNYSSKDVAKKMIDEVFFGDML
jgi:hypothetical protein